MIDVPTDSAAISAALKEQLDHGRYEKSELVGDGAAGARIAKHLAEQEFTIQKRITYID